MNKFWICFVEGTTTGKGKAHLSNQEAAKEAERLALLPENIGKKVYVLEATACCFTEKPLHWEYDRF